MSSISSSVGAYALSAETDSIKGQIVTGTLDRLNSVGRSPRRSWAGSQSAMSNTYDLTNSVVGGTLLGKGTIINVAG